MEPILRVVFYIAVLACLPTQVIAADDACISVENALEKGMVQPRIHNAFIDDKDGATTKARMNHLIRIGDIAYIIQDGNFLGGRSREDHEPQEEFYKSRTRLFVFKLFLSSTCKALGEESVAGRTATVIGIIPNDDTGEVIAKVWIDAATRLPVRTWLKGSDTDGKTGSMKDVYLYGDAVKEPSAKGAIAPATIARLEALFK